MLPPLPAKLTLPDREKPKLVGDKKDTSSDKKEKGDNKKEKDVDE